MNMRNVVLVSLMIGSSVCFSQAKSPVLVQKDLASGWGQAKVEMIDTGSSASVKIISTGGDAGEAAAVSTTKVAVTAEASYNISFRVRGNIQKLQAMFVIYKAEEEKGTRYDFLTPTPLTSDWQYIENTITIPKEDNPMLSISIFCWKENGWFEIKDFKMSAK
jgi:hypothetical protein